MVISLSGDPELDSQATQNHPILAPAVVDWLMSAHLPNLYRQSKSDSREYQYREFVRNRLLLSQRGLSILVCVGVVLAVLVIIAAYELPRVS
jgi:hypothetical protein